MNKSLRKLIPFRVACWSIIAINSLVILFHVLVISGIVPHDLVWGGKIQDRSRLYGFEAVSILVNLILIIAVVSKRRHPHHPNRVVNTVMWIFVLIFVLNTLGNLAAERRLEMLLATPLTFVLAVLCWRVAIERPVPGESQ